MILPYQANILFVAINLLLVVLGILCSYKDIPTNKNKTFTYITPEPNLTQSSLIEFLHKQDIYSAYFDERQLIRNQYEQKYNMTVFGVVRMVGLVDVNNMATENLICHTYPGKESKVCYVIITHYDVPARNMKPDTWHVIGNGTTRRKVYSAFYDDRPEMKKRYSKHNEEPIAGVVRIIGILQFKISEKELTCHLSYNNSDYTIESSVRVHAIRENWKFLFSASFIVCGVYANIVNSATGAVVLPDSVALSDGSLKVEQLQFLPVRYPLKNNQSEERPTLAVCVPPLFKKYDEYLSLIEYIEIYKLLGVNHFFFYNSSISDKVSQVLEYYQGKGQITVEQWNFTGYEFEKEVRYNGIFAALNDCLYRASFMHGFEYVVNTDMDEILFPRQHEDLLELLTTIEPQKAGIIFRNTFFFMNEKNETSVGNNFLLTQSKIVRTKEILPSHQRSKYIYKGRGVIELGNHFIWEYYPGYREHVLPESVGLSHHYRITCLGNYCNSYDGVQDTTARRYEDQLAANVEKACSEIFKTDDI